MDKYEPTTEFHNKMDWLPYAKRLDEQLSAYMSDDLDEAKVDVVRRMWV